MNQGAASIARRPRTRLCSPRSRSCRVRSSPRGPDGDAVKFIGERNQGSFLALTERLDELDDQPIPDCWPDIRHRRRRTRPILCRRQPARRPPPAARRPSWAENCRRPWSGIAVGDGWGTKRGARIAVAR